MLHVLAILTLFKVTAAAVTNQDVEFLNELPLDKLLRLKSSLQELVTVSYENATATPAPFLQEFGAQAMAIKAPPVKRTDYEESPVKKGGYSKVSNLFSKSVTTLAFLAFGGYLLCLIVQAIKAKQSYNVTTVAPTTIFLNAGIKKRPTALFSSYGKRREERSLKQIDLPPEELFSALLQLCEGYAKWSEKYRELGTEF